MTTMCVARRWTEKEEELVLNSCGLKTIPQLASMVGRTPKAVRNKLSRSGVSVYSNFYSATVLANELGRCRDVVMRWYREGWLRGRQSESRMGFWNPPMMFIEKDIAAFLERFFFLFAVKDYKKIKHPYFKKIVRDAHFAYWERG